MRGAKYHVIDLGVLTLGERIYAWAAPVVRPPDEHRVSPAGPA